jgi:hypothetical protein
MEEFDEMEIIRDNRVSRLLWFMIGFLSAAIILYFFSGHH